MALRDRIEIEKEADQARQGPSSPPTLADLTLEVLLDIRDRLEAISVKQTHLIEGVGLLRDIKEGRYSR
jgi:hypothetical protein